MMASRSQVVVSRVGGQNFAQDSVSMVGKNRIIEYSFGPVGGAK